MAMSHAVYGSLEICGKHCHCISYQTCRWAVALALGSRCDAEGYVKRTIGTAGDITRARCNEVVRQQAEAITCEPERAYYGLL
jgi:hypothetical protein